MSAFRYCSRFLTRGFRLIFALCGTRPRFLTMVCDAVRSPSTSISRLGNLGATACRMARASFFAADFLRTVSNSAPSSSISSSSPSSPTDPSSASASPGVPRYSSIIASASRVSARCSLRFFGVSASTSSPAMPFFVPRCAIRLTVADRFLAARLEAVASSSSPNPSQAAATTFLLVDFFGGPARSSATGLKRESSTSGASSSEDDDSGPSSSASRSCTTSAPSWRDPSSGASSSSTLSSFRNNSPARARVSTWRRILSGFSTLSSSRDRRAWRAFSRAITGWEATGMPPSPWISWCLSNR
mmetsp:Transcript_14210/g.28350  ORF Transcript_14210/g.28350 Transcript_14210/m.28350 type:complete len:301 (+) Transcript_14210:370-1272(+)